MQVLFVDTPEGTQIGPECRAHSPASVAMDLALTITIVIPRPFAHPVGNRGMARMAPPITLPFIGIEQCAAGRHTVSNKVVAGLPVRMVADPPALLSCVARDDADDGGTIVGIGTVPFALIGVPAWRIVGVAMRRAFFPPRSGTVRPPQRRCRALHRSAPCRRGVWSCLRERPSSRARRAMGSPLATPRSNSTRVAGRCRVFSKAVSVSSV